MNSISRPSSVRWDSLILDKNSPVPLYYQLAEFVKERIGSGDLQSGEQLPSAHELSEQLGISRMTTRQAIAYLVREGILVVKPGVGTFVAAPKLAYNAFHLAGFTEEVTQRGETAVSQVLEQTITAAPPYVLPQLGLTSAEPVVKIVRLRWAGDVPLLLETSYIAAIRCPGLEHEDLAAHSLYALLEQRYGLRPHHARQTLEATVANDYEGRLFNIRPGSPMLVLEGVTYLEQDAPLEYFKAIYRGDRLKFQFESRRNTVGDAGVAPHISLVLS